MKIRRKGTSVSGKKETRTFNLADKNLKTLNCKFCHSQVFMCGSDAVSVICSNCVQKMTAPPVSMVKKTGPPKPKGWKFMKVFVDSEKNVFFKGIEQEELKDTLEPTTIVPKERKKKLTPREKEKIEIQKNELFAEIVLLKKTLFTPSIPSKERKRTEKEIKAKEKIISKLSKAK